jgi:hypothetical protein
MDGWLPPRRLGSGGVVELSIDARGRPHVAFGTRDAVVHRWRSSDGWERRVIARDVDVISVDVRAFGREADIAWAQRDLPRGVWISPA